MYLYKKVA